MTVEEQLANGDLGGGKRLARGVVRDGDLPLETGDDDRSLRIGDFLRLGLLGNGRIQQHPKKEDGKEKAVCFRGDHDMFRGS